MGRNVLTLCFFWILSGIEIHAQYQTAVKITNSDGGTMHRRIENQLTAILSEFNAASTDKRAINWSGLNITEAAKTRIEGLWRSGRFRCKETDVSENILNLPGGGYQMRNIDFIVTDVVDSTHHENAVISFTANGELDDLYFGLEMHDYKKIMRGGADLTDFRRRQMILDFLENFRTAYNRKDLPFLQNTFSENALIIVGRVVSEKKVDAPDYLSSLGKQKVELIRMNKSQYMDNLKKVFTSNRFIDVGFDNIEIVRHGHKKDIYGVKLVQKWRSSGYSDAGYLFLMIDFEDEQNPLIHVRSWQPQDATSTDEVIDLGDFDLVK